jgi:hypothetical protein
MVDQRQDRHRTHVLDVLAAGWLTVRALDGRFHDAEPPRFKQCSLFVGHGKCKAQGRR